LGKGVPGAGDVAYCVATARFFGGRLLRALCLRCKNLVTALLTVLVSASQSKQQKGGRMKSAALKILLALAVCTVSAAMATRAAAAEWPMVPGDFWEVAGIHLKDGGGLAYANFLATEWKANQEFAKSKGWIKNYMVFSNNHPRKGEPDLYLVVIFERMPTGPEGDKREDEFTAWKKKTQAQMQKESANRLEIREVGSNALLQELKFRN
jgi:hypothetical protein